VLAQLNLANSNSWTALQQFTRATSTLFSALDGIFVGRNATSTIVGDTGTSTITGPLVIGTTTPGFVNYGALNITGFYNSYLQANIQNLSNGNVASSDYIATSNIGSDTTYYVDLGINGAGNSDPLYTMFGPSDAYLYSQSTSLSIGIATSTRNYALKFFSGGTLAANERARITAEGYFGIGTTTPRWLLTLASSTAPQLAFVDGSLTSNAWTVRSAGGSFYLATSSPSTYATSTATAIAIDVNGNVGIGSSTPGSALAIGSIANIKQGTSTFVGGIDLNSISTAATSTLGGLVTTKGITMQGLNCSTSAQLLQTDSSGNVICGTDDGGAGGNAFTASAGLITKDLASNRVSLIYGDATDVQLEIENITSGTVPAADAFQLNLTGGSGITTDGVDGIAINIEGADGANNAVSALRVNFDPISGSVGDNFYALNIEGVSGTTTTNN
jgi:hypothetical protein